MRITECEVGQIVWHQRAKGPPNGGPRPLYEITYVRPECYDVQIRMIWHHNPYYMRACADHWYADSNNIIRVPDMTVIALMAELGDKVKL